MFKAGNHLSKKAVGLSILTLLSVAGANASEARDNVTRAAEVFEPGLEASCGGPGTRITTCTASRTAEGAPTRVDFTKDLITLSFPEGCKDVGKWGSVTIARTSRRDPAAYVRDIASTLSVRSGNCGQVESERLSNPLDLSAILLAATR